MSDRFSISAAVSGTIACLIGISYLFFAKAPVNMVFVNTAAMITGLLLVLLMTRFITVTHNLMTVTAVAGSLMLLITSLFGPPIEGATRWMLIGPFFIQTSLILLPLIALAFATLQNKWTILSIVISAIAMAAQPDRAMAAMLCLTVLVTAIMKANRRVIAVALFCTGMFGVTLVLPDRLPAVPYVDHIYWTSFDINFVVGLSLWFGSLMMISPILFIPKTERSASHYVFTACWLAIIMAATIGAYPTPVVGYGFSAIIGYFLSLAIVSPLEQASLSLNSEKAVKAAEDTNETQLIKSLRPFAVQHS